MVVDHYIAIALFIGVFVGTPWIIIRGIKQDKKEG